MSLAVSLLLGMLVADGPKADLPPAATEKIDFEKQIWPIFTRRCHSCHGPDEQESGLRLDLRSAAMQGGDSGPWFKKGDSKQSDVIHRVAGVDQDSVMPPDGERVPPQEVSLLRGWIDQGAHWPQGVGAEKVVSDHWSFQPIVRPTVPSIEGAATAIDAFVLRQLDERNVKPSPPADRSTLLRRLYLDLLGLLPDPEAVDRFLADQRPDAYERLVDRVLASPAFGERWGRHWLDMARYADSDGYEKDLARPWAWRYRNWVIDAVNADMPYDQFTIQQLAGDMLPDAGLSQRIATGFHRNTLTNREGGVDQEEYRCKAVVDRVNTTGTVWLGLTIGCCECHSHKYDPLTQKEYYGFFTFFNNADERDIPAPLQHERAEYEKRKAQFDQQMAALRAKVAAFERDKLPARLARWEDEFTPSPVGWTVLHPATSDLKATGGVKLDVQKDGSVTAAGKNPAKSTYTVTVKTPLENVTAFRLEVLPGFDKKGPGRTPHGNFVLTHFAVKGGGEVKLASAKADFAQNGFDPAGALDAKAKTGWAISPQMGKAHVAVFETSQPLSISDGQALTLTLKQEYGTRHTIRQFRLSATTHPHPVPEDGRIEQIAQILKVPSSKRTKAQSRKLIDFYRTHDKELSALDAQVAALAKQAPAPPPTKAQTLYQRSEPRQTHVHVRGDFLRKGAEVSAHTPAVLPKLKSRNGTPDRLDLARWIVSDDNPLTARVAVNRVWRHLFGRGIVATISDFGTQGDPPSHPALLDWLADEYKRLGWSRKALIRTIVCSATYRQASHVRPELQQADPKNVLLARQNRFRLSAEVVRDVNLAASGLLSRKLGGPSIRPPLPADIAALGYANSVKWKVDRGADKYRRGLYIFFQRTVPYPMLMTFDAPDSNITCTRRERSNTPLQALTLLNDPVFFECAQALGKRIVAEADADASARLRHAFQICFSRPPSDAEKSATLKMYERVRDLCADSLEDSAQLAGDKRLQGTDQIETASWVLVARTLLNLDEFVTRE